MGGCSGGRSGLCFGCRGLAVVVDHDRVDEQLGVGDVDDAVVVVEHGVAEIDRADPAFEFSDENDVVEVKGLVDDHHDPGQQVGDGVLECEPEREAGQAQPGDQGADIDAKRAQCRDGSEEQHADLGRAAQEIGQFVIDPVAASHAVDDLHQELATDQEQNEDSDSRPQPGRERDGHLLHLRDQVERHSRGVAGYLGGGFNNRFGGSLQHRSVSGSGTSERRLTAARGL